MTGYIESIDGTLTLSPSAGRLFPRKRRGTPGMAVTRESMSSRQARGGGSA
jgi:hypothetical protein